MKEWEIVVIISDVERKVGHDDSMKVHTRLGKKGEFKVMEYRSGDQ